MATKIKTSLLANVGIDFDTNQSTSNVSSIYPKAGTDKKKEVEEVSFEGLNIPLLKSTEEKAVELRVAYHRFCKQMEGHA